MGLKRGGVARDGRILDDNKVQVTCGHDACTLPGGVAIPGCGRRAGLLADEGPAPTGFERAHVDPLDRAHTSRRTHPTSQMDRDVFRELGSGPHDSKRRYFNATKD